MSDTFKTAIVIAAYNEAASIASVVTSVSGFNTVIVIDDGSSDETAALAREAGATVVSHAANRGYDTALASGFAKAREMGMEAVVTFDADGQLASAAIPAALKALTEGETKLVLGVRDTGAARLSEALFNAYARLRFGVPDILCGLKGFRLHACEAYRERMEASSVNTALALALLRAGAAFAPVPVAVRPRAGKSRYGGTLRGNLRIFRALGRALVDDVLCR